MTVLNRGDAEAHSLKDMELIIASKDGIVKIHDDEKYHLIPDDKVLGFPEGGVAINIPFNTSKLFGDSTIIAFLKIAYKDNSGNSITPLRQFIKVPHPIQGEVIPEVTPAEETSLTESMKKAGYW